MGEAQAMRAMPEEESLHLSPFFFSCYMQSMKQRGSERGRWLQLVQLLPRVCNDLAAEDELRVGESRVGSGQQGVMKPAVQRCSVNLSGSMPQAHSHRN